jgi:hypothetical protein
MIKNLYDWLFKTKDNKFVIGQKPNLPITVWFVFLALGIITNDDTSTIFMFGSTISLIVWAMLELYNGVNNFRRILGFSVLVFVILSALTS